MTVSEQEQKQTLTFSLEDWDIRTRVVLRKDYDPRRRHYIPGAKYRPLQNTFFMGRLDIPRDVNSCRLLRRFEPMATDDQGQLMHQRHATEKQVTEAGEIEKVCLKEWRVPPHPAAPSGRHPVHGVPRMMHPCIVALRRDSRMLRQGSDRQSVAGPLSARLGIMVSGGRGHAA